MYKINMNGRDTCHRATNHLYYSVLTLCPDKRNIPRKCRLWCLCWLNLKRQKILSAIVDYESLLKRLKHFSFFFSRQTEVFRSNFVDSIEADWWILLCVIQYQFLCSPEVGPFNQVECTGAGLHFIFTSLRTLKHICDFVDLPRFFPRDFSILG